MLTLELSAPRTLYFLTTSSTSAPMPELAGSSSLASSGPGMIPNSPYFSLRYSYFDIFLHHSSAFTTVLNSSARGTLVATTASHGIPVAMSSGTRVSVPTGNTRMALID